MKKLVLIVVCVLLSTLGVHAQDLTLFQDANGKFGYKDAKGKVVVPARYDGAYFFPKAWLW